MAVACFALHYYTGFFLRRLRRASFRSYLFSTLCTNNMPFFGCWWVSLVFIVGLALLLLVEPKPNHIERRANQLLWWGSHNSSQGVSTATWQLLAGWHWQVGIEKCTEFNKHATCDSHKDDSHSKLANSKQLPGTSSRMWNHAIKHQSK